MILFANPLFIVIGSTLILFKTHESMRERGWEYESMRERSAVDEHASWEDKLRWSGTIA